jgi:hypothetical protein
MTEKLKYFLLLLICTMAQTALAQYPSTSPNNLPGQQQNIYRQGTGFDTTTRKVLTADQQIDTLRKKEQNGKDSIVFSSKFIRVTAERYMNDSTVTFPLDTGLTNFENYSPLFQPKSPKISLGWLGTAERNLLLEPTKTIGFDVGLHALDAYLWTPQNIQYYRARVPLTLLSVYYSGVKEQDFRIVHTQNINKYWNIGFNLNFIGSRGVYATQVISQNVSNTTGDVYTWHESKNKRYNLLAALVFNNLKSPETGSILNDSLFTSKAGSFDKTTERVRLPNTYENWKTTSIYIKQFYYIGHVDTAKTKGIADEIKPTQRVSYTFNYNTQKYEFLSNDIDIYHVFPDYYFASNRSRDSLSLHHLQNDFSYSFYLRGKGGQFAKNEFKLDVGLTHDLYSYQQLVSDSTTNSTGVRVRQIDQLRNKSFEDVTLKGKATYRLSDKLGLELTINQIAVGRDFGDFLYEGKALISGSKKTGRIILDGYTQSSTPPLVYTDWVSNHYIFSNAFKNQKTTSVSFNYINDALQIDLKAEYFLISDYLYFASPSGGVDATPMQLSSPVNLLKFSAGKNLTLGNWHFDNYVVYEKTDYQSTLRIPSLYTYSSLYYNTLLFQVLHSAMGINVRWNSAYVAPSYATGLGQFYNGANVTFSSYPVASVYFKATIQHTNFFLMYDYANQGLFSKGYYTVNRYPQQDAALKVGISWYFYN